LAGVTLLLGDLFLAKIAHRLGPPSRFRLLHPNTEAKFGKACDLFVWTSLRTT
jgi:hypothetical protein